MELLEKHFETAFDSPNGIKELRSLILKLAMMGKLVPQDVNDQPASELLKEVVAEKEKLISEGKIRKQKTLSALKPEDIPYEIPMNWEWIKFNNVNEVQSELVNPVDYPDEKQIAPDIIEKDTGKLISSRTVLESGVTGPNNRFYQSQIIYSKIRPSLNKIVIAPYDGLCSADMYPIRCFIDLDFMLRLMLSDVFLKQVIVAENRVKMPKINLESLNNFHIPLPPLNEQKRIVTKINELMARCDEMERLKKAQEEKRLQVNTAALHLLLESPDKESFQNSFNFITRNFSHIYSVKENVEELKKAILQLAMMGKLVPQDPNDQPASELLKKIQAEKEKLIGEGKIKRQKDLPEIRREEIPYELPAGWVWTSIDKIALSVTDGVHYAPNYVGSGVPCISAKDVYANRINLENCNYVTIDEYESQKQKFMLQEKSLLVTKSGSIGRTAIIESLYDLYLVESIGVINFQKEFVVTEYIKYIFDEEFSTITYDGKYVRGLGVKHLTLRLIKSIQVPFPPLKEQKRIVTKINELMGYCDSMIEKIDHSEETREKLLQSVLTNV